MIQTKILGHAGVAYSGDEQITFYIILKLDFLRYKFSGTEVKKKKKKTWKLNCNAICQNKYKL